VLRQLRKFSGFAATAVLTKANLCQQDFLCKLKVRCRMRFASAKTTLEQPECVR